MAQEPVRFEYRCFPAEPRPCNNSPRLDLKVIFTDLPKTAAALRTARTMARGLGARITLVVTQVVPYPLPLTAPPVPVEFTQRVVESVAVNQGAGDPDDADTTIEIYLCRDRLETIRRALPPDSVVIVGARKRLSWPSWERTLTSTLRHDGRRVLVVTV